jgi:hypothetical protein
MAIDYQRLLAWPVPEVRQTYSLRDSQLYALAVGLGADPTDTRQLPFVYEQNPQALPTQAVVLGYPGFWMKEPGTGVDWVRLVHAEQGLTLHRPLPASGEVIGRTRVTGINDKGPGKGAIVYSQRTLHDAASDELIATLDSSTFCRGDGGCGGSDASPMTMTATPERAPDAVCELPTLPQQALLYRLCGDFNPLHADLPWRARPASSGPSCMACARSRSPATRCCAWRATTTRRGSPHCGRASRRRSTPARHCARRSGARLTAWPFAPAPWSATSSC